MFLQGSEVWSVFLFALLTWLVVAVVCLAVLYWVIRLAVRHALHDAARSEDPPRINAPALRRDVG